MAVVTPISSEEPSGVTPGYLRWGPLLLRAVVTVVIVLLFAWVNVRMISLIETFAASDIELVKSGVIGPEHRLINENVLMSLIAGTVTQVVVVLLGITRFLFPASE